MIDPTAREAPVVPRWVDRAAPLAPVAVYAEGPARLRLRDALLRRRSLAGLAGVGNASVLVVTGEALPWAEGVGYLGRDPDAPGVLLPTLRRPAVPLDLFATAVLARAPRDAWPLAVIEPGLLVPLGHARGLAHDDLRFLA